MEDLLNAMRGISDAISNPYDSRKVARDEINGVTISTVNSADMGYETAVFIEGDGVNIAERYPNLESAKEGHIKWCEKVKDGLTEFEAVGYGSMQDDYNVTLNKKGG